MFENSLSFPKLVGSLNICFCREWLTKKSKDPDIFSIYDEVCCQVEFSPLMEKGVVDGSFLATQRKRRLPRRGGASQVERSVDP